MPTPLCRAQNRGRAEEAPSREPSDVDLSHWGKRNMEDEDYERQIHSFQVSCGPASVLECAGLLLGWSLHLARVL